MYQYMRRLHPRGRANRGIAVDVDGAMLGPDCNLVRRTAQGYRCVAPGEAAALQSFLLGDGAEPDWLFRQCQRIAKALDGQEIAFAQILGLRIPVKSLESAQVTRLAHAAPFIKANFNPNQPRIPTGQHGGGEWTTDGRSRSDASRAHGEPAAGALLATNVMPVQMTIPWDLPAEIPWRIPGAPTEITPIPFDFPGAEREPPPLPTNPFPRDPECAEEWAAAHKYCDKMQQEGKFRRGYTGPGKDYRSCLLGQVSEGCGGNPTA